jgi:MtN3 and saliva related transmembrane protein
MEVLKNIIGFSASIVGVSVMLPQVYKSIRTKSVSDISWGMLVLFLLNCFLWLIYGIILFAIPLIITNSISLCIGVLQIFLKIKYTK